MEGSSNTRGSDKVLGSAPEILLAEQQRWHNEKCYFQSRESSKERNPEGERSFGSKSNPRTNCRT